MKTLRNLVRAAVAACAIPDQIEKLIAQNRALKANNHLLRQRCVEAVADANAAYEKLHLQAEESCEKTRRLNTLATRCEELERRNADQRATIHIMKKQMAQLRMSKLVIRAEKAKRKYEQLRKTTEPFEKNMRALVGQREAEIVELKNRLAEDIDSRVEAHRREMKQMKTRCEELERRNANQLATVMHQRELREKIQREFSRYKFSNANWSAARADMQNHIDNLTEQRDNLVAKKERQAAALTELQERNTTLLRNWLKDKKHWQSKADQATSKLMRTRADLEDAELHVDRLDKVLETLRGCVEYMNWTGTHGRDSGTAKLAFYNHDQLLAAVFLNPSLSLETRERAWKSIDVG